MRRILRLTFLAGLLFCHLSCFCQDTNFWIFLCFGRANMEGFPGIQEQLTAEGGTGWGHAVTMARARKLAGPYELHPDLYILSARHRPDVDLQRAGHADLVETQNGETYMVYLCGRPLRNRGRCTLGRETAIQKMVWGSDDWLRTLDGKGIPTLETPAPTSVCRGGDGSSPAVPKSSVKRGQAVPAPASGFAPNRCLHGTGRDCRCQTRAFASRN